MADRQFYKLQKIIVPLAIFFILYVSTGSFGYMALNIQTSVLFYPQLVFSIVSAMGINLLLMSFGMYQLKMKHNAKKLWRNIWTIMIGIMIFSLVSYTYSLLVAGNISKFNLGTFFSDLLQTSYSSYNVLYVLLGAFITMPFIKVLADNLKENLIKYLFWLEIIFVGFLPVIIYFTGITSVNLSIPIAIQGGVFFPLMGYWLNNPARIKKITREQLLIAWIVTVCCYIVMVGVTMYQSNIENNVISQSFFQSFQAIPCLTFFLSMEVHVMNKKSKPNERILKDNFVKLAYGVMLFSGIFMEPLKVIYDFFQPLLGYMLGSIIWIFVTMLISYIVTIIVSHTKAFSHLFLNLFISDARIKVKTK